MAGTTAAKRDLAQFFTPEPVVEFVFDALAALGLRAGPLRLVDPACGDGAFLRAAARRFPEAELWGCDVDGALAASWDDGGLGGRAHVLVQDGLVDAPLFGLGAGTFDVVVGNPPYGFGVARPGRGERIEELFVRRFVALARPGGWLGMVLPQGIVANVRGQALRDWLAERMALHAVVELPRGTFAAGGTQANTVVVLGRKGGKRGQAVLLAKPADGGRGDAALRTYLDQVLNTLRGRDDVSAGSGER